jgi:hypothetical protein
VRDLDAVMEELGAAFGVTWATPTDVAEQPLWTPGDGAGTVPLPPSGALVELVWPAVESRLERWWAGGTMWPPRGGRAPRRGNILGGATIARGRTP